MKSGEGDTARLVERLAEAEAALAAIAAGRVDAVVNPQGASFLLLKEAQKALQESEARAKEHAALLDALLSNAPDFIGYVDAERKIRFSNRLPSGDDVRTAIGSDWLAVADAEDDNALGRVFDSVIATGKSTSHEGPGRGANGRVSWYSRRLGPVIREGQVIGVVVITRDVTDAKNAEAQLMDSDRMASMGTLAAGVAHEINNPLAAVMINLEAIASEMKSLSERTAVPHELVECIDDARNAADRVRLIVRDLRIFSRAEEDKHGPIDVERVIESTLRMAWNEIRHRARLVKDYGRVPPISGNEPRLAQVFLNLIVNAAQAVPEGNVEGNLIRISTSRDDENRIVIKISDTGAGIPIEVQKRMFTPFFTTKPAGTGTGLGLSICRRIITAHGGEITFESAAGKGTEFRVRLPVAKFVDVSETQNVATPLLATRRGRVLVIDDEVAIVSATKRVLTEHEVIGIDRATRALDLLKDGFRFDMILCDLMMPQMTGIEFYRILERIDAEQAERVVFMTGGAFTPKARQFLDEVKNHRLEKPFDFHGLRLLINSIVK